MPHWHARFRRLQRSCRSGQHQFWQSTATKFSRSTPQAKGLPVGLTEKIPVRALSDLFREIRPSLIVERPIWCLAAWLVEQFPREAGEVLPASRT
jgi:hypothetical protein